MNLQTIALCSVSAFRKEGKEKDTNGNQNVFLSPLSGKIPNKCMVLAGTVALNNDIEIGKTYVFKFTEKEPDPEYGRQFNTQKIAEASVMDIMEASTGKQPEVINVSEPVTEKGTVDEFANSEEHFSTK